MKEDRNQCPEAASLLSINAVCAIARNEAHKWSRIVVGDCDGHSIYDAGAGIIPANGRQRRTQRPVSSQDWPPTKSFKLQPGNRYNLGGEDHENIEIVAACSEIGRASCRERVCQYV